MSLYSALLLLFFFFFKQKTAYEMLRSLVGSEMCIRDSPGRAAPLLRVQRRNRLHQLQRARRQRMDFDLGGVRRSHAARVPVQPGVVDQGGTPLRAESVALDVARMADARHAAEARQLGQGSAGGVSLGVRLQRARRAGRLRAAERAARRSARG